MSATRRSLLGAGATALAVAAGRIAPAAATPAQQLPSAALTQALMQQELPDGDMNALRWLTIANGSPAPIRRRALLAVAREAERLAALEPADPAETVASVPDAAASVAGLYQRWATEVERGNRIADRLEVGEAGWAERAQLMTEEERSSNADVALADAILASPDQSVVAALCKLRVALYLFPSGSNDDLEWHEHASLLAMVAAERALAREGLTLSPPPRRSHGPLPLPA